MTDKDKAIQQLLDQGKRTKSADADEAAYRALYAALGQAPPLEFSEGFAERVTAQVIPVTSPTPWSTVLMIGCIAAALLASGLMLHRIDPLVFWKLTSWMLLNKELIGFGVGLFAAIQVLDRWLIGRAR